MPVVLFAYFKNTARGTIMATSHLTDRSAKNLGKGFLVEEAGSPILFVHHDVRTTSLSDNVATAFILDFDQDPFFAKDLDQLKNALARSRGRHLFEIMLRQRSAYLSNDFTNEFRSTNLAQGPPDIG
jgi:hypothetical protein